MGRQARAHTRAPRPIARRLACKVRHPLGPARCTLLRLREPRLAPSRLFRAAKGSSMTPDPNSYPRLAPGCRLGENNQQRVLLMPERALRLNGPSLEIVSRCDGKHTVKEIIGELQKIYSQALPERVEQDILGYLGLLHDQRALDFT